MDAMKTGGLMGRGAVAALCLVLSGCLAQQADLVQVRKDLDARIDRLDQREKEIQKAVAEANSLIVQQKKEVDELVSETRAKLRHEVAELREDSLPKVHGKLEENAHHISRLVQGVEDASHRIAAVEKTQKTQLEQVGTLKLERDRFQEELGKLVSRMDGLGKTLIETVKTIETKLEEQQKMVRANDAQTATLTKRVDTQTRALTDQLAEFRGALTEFKKALASLGDQQVLQEQRTEALQAKIDSDRKDVATHLAQVNKSVDSVVQSLKTISETLVSRIDEQDRRVEGMTQQTAALQHKLESDSKATVDHLGEVNRSVGTVVKSLETVSETVMARIEEQDRRLDAVVDSLELTTKRVNQLQQGLPPVREAREVPKAAGSKRESDGIPEHRRQPVSGSEPMQSASLSPGAGLGPHPFPGGSSGDPMAETDRDAYDRVMQQFKKGDLGESLKGFSEFLARYPHSSLAPNAQYWVGECYYGTKNYERAIEAFDRVKTAYPDSDKVPAALLKKGFAYLSLNDRAQASSVLKQVVDGYPKTPEASKARDKLAQLKQAR